MRTDLAMIMDELHKMQAQLAHLQRSIEERDAKPQAHADRRQAESARASELAAHLGRWEPRRARWPNLKAHPNSERAFDLHVQTLGKEPEPENIARLAADLPIGRVWRYAGLASFLNKSDLEAKAMLFFLQVGGHARWVEKKGYVLLKDENIAGAV